MKTFWRNFSFQKKCKENKNSLQICLNNKKYKIIVKMSNDKNHFYERNPHPNPSQEHLNKPRIFRNKSSKQKKKKISHFDQK